MSTDAAVQAQYEALPYPARDPRDEAKRLLTGSPSHLLEVEHFVFGGRFPRAIQSGEQPLRVLVAGGGTGDALVMLGQQAADRGIRAELTYLDRSEASRRIAEARMAARGLAARFVTGSLLELDRLDLGLFDYIDCCGVLHHLPEPEAGMAQLGQALAPLGGIGVMVYGRLGRSGVYDMQEALRLVAGAGSEAERVAVSKRVLAHLPPGNQLRRNPVVRDHVEGGDAGLFDLLLHASDRAYLVEELIGLVESAQLRVAALIEPLRYEPASYVSDPLLRRKFAELEWRQRAILAERLAGTMARHIVYAVRRDNDVAVPAIEGSAVPVLRDTNAGEVAKALGANAVLEAVLADNPVSFALPPLAVAIVRQVDGLRSIDEIFQAVAALRSGLRRPEYDAAFAELYRVLGGMNRMLLRLA